MVVVVVVVDCWLMVFGCRSSVVAVVSCCCGCGCGCGCCGS